MRPMRSGVLVLLAACRIGFDDTRMASDDAPVIDAAPDTPTTDSAIDAINADCPASYTAIPGTTSKYKAVDNSSTWTQAQSACVADGTHLVIFDNATERSLVTGVLLPLDDWWVGVTDRVALGTWLTVTNEPAAYLPWTSGEPDLVSTERCVEAESPAFNFIDQDCAAGRRYVCECDGKASVPSSY
jgi:hypothetical protein